MREIVREVSRFGRAAGTREAGGEQVVISRRRGEMPQANSPAGGGGCVKSRRMMPFAAVAGWQQGSCVRGGSNAVLCVLKAGFYLRIFLSD